MVLRVCLLEVGGSTGGALGKAFFPFTFRGALAKAFFPFTFRGALGKAFFPFTFRGALGKAFFPFTFFYGTGTIGGGAERSTSESDDWTSFIFTSLPWGKAKRGLERTSNS